MIRFMVRDREPVTIEHVLDHFDHVAKLVGVEHVGVGSDLDLVGNPNAVNGGGFDPRDAAEFRALPVSRGRRRRDHHPRPRITRSGCSI